jgi:hypothetical protein
MHSYGKDVSELIAFFEPDIALRGQAKTRLMSPKEIESRFMSVNAVAVGKAKQLRAFWDEKRNIHLGIIAFTIFYYIDVCLRSSGKYFWYDEILTLYFSRFSSLSQLWGALHSGIESNPPGFHLLTRASEAIFGENLVGTRMPEIVSFWLLCLCLFRFVDRRAGAAAGFVAMMLPMLSGAYFYAYEARPLIILAALAGMALLCWDNAIGFRAPVTHTGRWLTGFSFCLLAALMMHCYGVLLLIPFASVELYRTIKSRRVDWRVWACLTFPLLPALFLYPAMFRSFRAVSEGTDFAQLFPANWPAVLKVYSFLFTPCLAVLLLFLILVAHHRGSSQVDPQSERLIRFDWDDTLLCIGFAALPAFGVILGKIAHTPYFERYFLSAVLGFCIPFGVIAGTIRSGSYRDSILVTVIAATLVLNFGRLVRHRLTGSGETLVEPSTKKELATTVGKPLIVHPLIEYRTRKGTAPIAVLDPVDFLYLVHYAPELNSRLYYVHPSIDEALRAFEAFRPWSPVKYNPALTGAQLATRFKRFYVYGDAPEYFSKISRLGNIQMLWANGQYLLASVQTE